MVLVIIGAKDMDDRMVDLTVGLMSFDILVPILGGSDSNNNNEGEEDQAG